MKIRNWGFSTLEMLVAFAVVILALTATISLVFSSQSLAIDSQTHAEALEKAKDLLQATRSQGAGDFDSINPISSTQDDIYSKSLNVQQENFFIKKITTNVNWVSEGRSQNVQLTSLLSNWKAALDGNTCSAVLSGDWTHPQINSYDLGVLINNQTSNYTVSDLDVYRGKLYIALSSTVNKTDPTFFVFDISSNNHQPGLISSVDNDSKVLAGLNSLRVSGKYAYLASASSYSRGQLQILDISQSPPQIISTFKIPVNNPNGAAKGLGNTIFYRRGLVYLGLTKTDSESEFNAIDVSNPANPVLKGTYDLDNDINAIYIKGNYAYLAHPASATQPIEQLTVLDVSDVTKLKRVSGFFYTGSSGGNGKSLSVIGDKLYFGRTASKISGSSTDSIPELFILDDGRPTSVPSTALGSLPLATPESVNRLIIRNNLAFLLTNSQLQIWNLLNLNSITPWTSHQTTSEFLPLPGTGASMDCEGDYFYLASNPPNGKAILSIISPGL